MGICKLAGRFKARSILCICLITGAAAVNIYAGYQLTSFYDILTSSNIESVIYKGIMLALIWVAAVIFQYIAAGYQANLVKLYKVYLRDEIMHNILDLSSEEFAQKEGGEYASWLVNDIQQIEENAILPFFKIVQGIGMTIFAVIALSKLHWILLIGAVLSAVVLSIIPGFFTKKLKNVAVRLSQCNEKFSQKTYNLFAGFEVFFIADRLNRMKDKIRATYISSEKQKYEFAVQSAVMNMAIDSVYRVFELMLEILAAILSFMGIVNFGALFAISNLTNRFMAGVDSVLPNIALMRSTNVLFDKFERAGSGLKRKEKDVCELPPIEKGIEVNNLVIHYGEKKVLDGSSYNFEMGKNYAIVGESGSGKTSLVRTIIGLNSAYDGEILFDGHDSKDYDFHSILSRFSYISQDTYLFNDTIRFNLTLGDEFCDQDIYDVLQKVNLTEFVNGEADGLERIISNQQNNISGGQRQRLGIARALLQKKRIFIIDEGTSALDSKNAEVIEKLFLDNCNYTVLFITHHLKERGKRFDRVYTVGT